MGQAPHTSPWNSTEECRNQKHREKVVREGQRERQPRFTSVRLAHQAGICADHACDHRRSECNLSIHMKMLQGRKWQYSDREHCDTKESNPQAKPTISVQYLLSPCPPNE